jgi:hypothetical protein
MPNSPNPVDGTWQPVVLLEACFKLQDGPRPADRFQDADICALCRSRILTELMSKYAVPDLLP